MDLKNKEALWASLFLSLTVKEKVIINDKLEKSNSVLWSEIASKSAKIISFFDLAGHEKYLRTTILFYYELTFKLVCKCLF